MPPLRGIRLRCFKKRFKVVPVHAFCMGNHACRSVFGVSYRTYHARRGCTSSGPNCQRQVHPLQLHIAIRHYDGSTRPICRVVTGDARFWNRKARAYAASKIADLPGYEQTPLARSTIWGHSRTCSKWVGGSLALRLAPSVAAIGRPTSHPEMIAIANGKLARAPDARFCSLRADDATTRDTANLPTVTTACSRSMCCIWCGGSGGHRRMRVALRPGGLLIPISCLRE